VRLDDEIRDIALWDVIRVAPGVVRAFEAGPDGLELIAVGGPKPEGGDGVRSEGRGRTTPTLDRLTSGPTHRETLMRSI
jgi:hypothetical protein